MSVVTEFALYLFGQIVLWVVVFPLLWIICTPYILIVAAFGPDPYRESVASMYGGVNDFWRKWGVIFPP